MLHQLLNIRTLFIITQSLLSAATEAKAKAGFLSLSQGRAQGLKTRVEGVYRYTLPYAKPPVGPLRWQDPQPPLNWSGIYRAIKLPPPCPQSQPEGAYLINEDCLYLSVYIPQRLLKRLPGRAPIFFWVHGGSLVTGSASGYGLDGASLAEKSDLVVIVAQYRLGLLGFLKTPASDGANALTGNYGIKDLVMALNYVQKNANSFGADHHQVTVAGHSSGAGLIKTLLSVKSAKSLFKQAILQSAPLNYGDHTIRTAELIGSAVLSALKCTSDELRTKPSVSQILAAQNSLQQALPSRIPGLAMTEPFKPVVDGSLVSVEFINGMNEPSEIFNNKRKVIFTTVKDEAGPTISDTFQPNTPPAVFESALAAKLASSDSGRLKFLASSRIYTDELKELVTKNTSDATRDELNVFGTDYIWRCPNQQAAVNLTINSKNFQNPFEVWIGEFDSGIPYESTTSIAYCKSKVCHEDDILSVFGLPPGKKSTAANERLIEEIQRRWASFAAAGHPNAPGYITWSMVEGPKQLNLLKIGQRPNQVVQQQRNAACQGLWGVKARFDAQINS